MYFYSLMVSLHYTARNNTISIIVMIVQARSMMESRQQSNSLAAGIHLLKGRKKFVPQCSYVCHLDTFTVVKDCLVYPSDSCPIYHVIFYTMPQLFSTLCHFSHCASWYYDQELAPILGWASEKHYSTPIIDARTAIQFFWVQDVCRSLYRLTFPINCTMTHRNYLNMLVRYTTLTSVFIAKAHMYRRIPLHPSLAWTEFSIKSHIHGIRKYRPPLKSKWGMQHLLYTCLSLSSLSVVSFLSLFSESSHFISPLFLPLRRTLKDFPFHHLPNCLSDCEYISELNNSC